MLKYIIDTANVCNGDKSGYNQAKCNKSLLDNITKNEDFLLWKRCLFMTFDEYTKRIHINEHIYSKVWDKVNGGDIKNTISEELKNIKANLNPSSLSIPLPIYVMLAKIINVDSFEGNYEMILYIPNLFKYNGKYTFFPSLDAFSKQNRWMELMTSSYSKYLQIIKIGMLKDRENTIIKKNYFKNDLTQSCLNLGCVSNEKDGVIIPQYSTDEASLISSANYTYNPTRCLRTPYYVKHMPKFNQEDKLKYGSRDENIFTDKANIETHCNDENSKLDKDKTFDKFLCTKIIKEKLCEKDSNYATAICYNNGIERSDKGKVGALLVDFYKNNLYSGTKDIDYSEDYSINILKELAFRKSKFPGPDNIQEIVFSIFRIDERYFDPNLFCFMPWGNKLLTQDYVISEDDSLEIDRVSLKSFNNVYEIKFQPDGYLYLFENNNVKSIIPNHSGSFKCFTKRVLKFENMSLNIYGYDIHNNNDLRGYVKLNIISMYKTPASIILSNNGELIIYDLGINNRTN
jgi:hypothetical protein